MGQGVLTSLFSHWPHSHLRQHWLESPLFSRVEVWPLRWGIEMPCLLILWPGSQGWTAGGWRVWNVGSSTVTSAGWHCSTLLTWALLISPGGPIGMAVFTLGYHFLTFYFLNSTNDNFNKTRININLESANFSSDSVESLNMLNFEKW